jgi:hypothetical protein
MSTRGNGDARGRLRHRERILDEISAVHLLCDAGLEAVLSSDPSSGAVEILYGDPDEPLLSAACEVVEIGEARLYPADYFTFDTGAWPCQTS